MLSPKRTQKGTKEQKHAVNERATYCRHTPQKANLKVTTHKTGLRNYNLEKYHIFIGKYFAGT